MNADEHLLTILAEECAEVAQRVSKALRFGLNEIQPGQPLTNAQRIREEFADLLAVYDILVAKQLLTHADSDMLLAKMEKVSKYLDYSRKCGTLQ